MSQGKQNWPKVGTKHEILREHGTTLMGEIQQLLENTQAYKNGTTRAHKEIPAKVYEPLFESMLVFIRRATRPDKNETQRLLTGNIRNHKEHANGPGGHQKPNQSPFRQHQNTEPNNQL